MRLGKVTFQPGSRAGSGLEGNLGHGRRQSRRVRLSRDWACILMAFDGRDEGSRRKVSHTFLTGRHADNLSRIFISKEKAVNSRLIFPHQLFRVLLLLGLAVLLAVPGAGLAQASKMVQSKQQLYTTPNLSADVLGTVPEGSEVKIVQQSGDWYQVEYQGQQGWLPQQAFGAGKKFELSNLLKGKAVQETKTDEVALAGKGFTPEVEAGYRQKHPNLNFALVDQVIKFEVSPGQLQAFMREGGLQ
jgi:hypothetical protein